MPACGLGNVARGLEWEADLDFSQWLLPMSISSHLSALIISCGNKTYLLSLSINQGQIPYIFPHITKPLLSSEEHI